MVNKDYQNSLNIMDNAVVLDRKSNDQTIPVWIFQYSTLRRLLQLRAPSDRSFSAD